MTYRTDTDVQHRESTRRVPADRPRVVVLGLPHEVWLENRSGQEGVDVVAAHDGADLNAALASGRVDAVVITGGARADQSTLSLLAGTSLRRVPVVVLPEDESDPASEPTDIDMRPAEQTVPMLLPSLLRWLASIRDVNILRHGALEVDLTACAVRVDGEIVDFTAREFALLSFMARSPGHVFSREDLLRSVWGATAETQSSATVTEHIRRVRAKLAAHHAAGRLVTVRGLGYRFES